MAFDPISLGIEFAGKLIDRFFPDATKAAEAKADLLKMQISGEFQTMMGQLNINMEEAKSTNWFIAGWRPFVGWSCGFGLVYAAILDPIARFFSTVIFGYTGSFPVIDTSLTMQVLIGMLGLGAMRSAEKIKGAEGNR
jgi:hypothetical protein